MWIINYEHASSGLSGAPLETVTIKYDSESEFRIALGKLLVENNTDYFRLRYHYETEEVVIGVVQ